MKKPTTRDDISVSKIDPTTMFSPPPQRSAPPQLEPIQPKTVIPQAPIPEEIRTVTGSAPEPKPLPHPISDDLLTQLEQEYSLEPLKTREGTLTVNNKKMHLKFRLPVYDDYIWGMGLILDLKKDAANGSIFGDDRQRMTLLQHMVACRCIIEINNKYVWDLFSVTKQIKTLVPHWDGKDANGIPELYAAEIATKLFDWTRQKLPTDFLFDFWALVDKEQQAPQETDEDPTETP
jgi:hypothetical protein